MSTTDQTTANQQSPDMGLLLIVNSPRYIPGYGQQEYTASVIADTIRHNVTLPLEGTVTNTPHGYYIVDDDTVAGGKLLFEFFTGDDAYAALREARASMQVERDSVRATPSPGSLAGGQSGPQSHRQNAPRTQDRGEKSPGTGLRGGPSRVPTADAVPEPHLSADLPGIQGLTLVDPMKMVTSSIPGEQAFSQRFTTRLDRNSLIPLHSVWATHHCKMHTVALSLDDAHHPIGPRGWEYNLLLDTGSAHTWFYALDFRMVPEAGLETKPWSRKDRENTQGVGSKKFIDPPRSHGEPAFDLKKPPSHANERMVTFGDGAVIFRSSCSCQDVRHLLDHNIHAEFPCWDWKKNKPAKTTLKLPCVLAYGVNQTEVKFRWDGGLGLRISPGFYDDYRRERPSHYLMALESVSHVEKPYEFLIKLNHPDKPRPSFVYHGQQFPCENKPTFTPKVPLSFHTSGSRNVYTAWSVWLKAIGFQVFQLQPANRVGGSSSAARWLVSESYTIDLTKPFHTDTHPTNDNPMQSQGTSSKVERALRKLEKPGRPQQPSGKAPQSQKPPLASEPSNPLGINITLDTGSARTWLPASVVNEMAVTWLRNDPALLASSGTAAYCGPERNLDQCEVVFTFVGHNGQPVELRCPAKPFFKAPLRLELRGATAPVSGNHYHSNLSRVVQLNTIAGPKAQTSYIFGVHSSPPAHHAGMLAETPYVQFAPQKAVRKSDGRVVQAEGFPLLQSQTPRQSRS
ncbi:hypothetical protein BD413DRAFT_492267 [Trametes elegans]|nr:hypothetical protein BD413DRAFT_492267 [Trametes elegans]